MPDPANGTTATEPRLDPFATAALLKRLVEEAPASQRVPVEADAEEVFRSRGAIEPPFNPEALILVKERSNALAQAIEAMAQNVDGYGFRLAPTIDLAAADAWDRVKELIVRERARWREELGAVLEPTKPPFGEPFGEDPVPDDATVERVLEGLRAEAEAERQRLEAFFCFCAADQAFVDLRKDTRRDLELGGNAYWEVLRDERGRLAGIERLPAFSVRLLPADTERTGFVERLTRGPYDRVTVRRRKRFRRFVQLGAHGVAAAYFREFRDPRLISRSTGEVVQPGHDREDLANEVIHLRLFAHDRSVYGVPRWIGVLPAVLGSREAEEVNLWHFGNKSLPIGFVTVAGAAAGDGTQARINDFLENHIRGQKNYHRVMVLEATLGEGAREHAGIPRIGFLDLSRVSQRDALFVEYDEKNREKIRSAFRLPPFFLGEIRDFNRASAQVARTVAEEQVFKPERTTSDAMVNRLLLPELDAQWWTFESRGLPLSDPETVAAVTGGLVEAGVVTPGEVRTKLSEALGVPLAALPDLLGALPPRVLGALLPALPADAVLRALGLEAPGSEPAAKADLAAPLPAGQLVPAQELPEALRRPTSFSTLTPEERDERLYQLAGSLARFREEVAGLRAAEIRDPVAGGEGTT